MSNFYFDPHSYIYPEGTLVSSVNVELIYSIAVLVFLIVGGSPLPSRLVRYRLIARSFSLLTGLVLIALLYVSYWR
jgi:hypothetical protein